MSAARQPDYNLESILLFADRTGLQSFNDDGVIDLTPAVIDFEFYENIERNFISGKISFADTVSFRKFYGIFGTERIQFKIDFNDDIPLIRDFIVTSIEKAQSAESGEVILLNFIQEHAYFGALKTISKKFENVPEIILANINKEYFNKETEQYYDQSQNHERPMRYIAPQITPLQAIDNIRDRMCTRTGGAYFTYARLNSENLFVSSLDYLLSLDPFDNKPLVYTQSRGASDLVNSYYDIESYTVKNNMSTFEMARHGILNSQMITLDSTSGLKTIPEHTDVSKLIGEITKSNEQIDIDPDLLFRLTQEISISDITSKKLSTIISGRQFAQQESITTSEPLGFHDDNPEHFKLRLQSALTRLILMNSMYTVDMSGLHHTVNINGGVGSLVNITFMSPTVYYQGFANEAEDPNRSGRFMVYRVVHRFSEGSYRAITDVVRLGKKTS